MQGWKWLQKRENTHILTFLSLSGLFQTKYNFLPLSLVHASSGGVERILHHERGLLCPCSVTFIFRAKFV